MAKPTDLFLWATDTNYPMDAEPEEGTATKVAPILAKIETGYRPAEKPKSQGLNYLLYQIALWLAWTGNRIRTYMISASDGRELDTSAGLWVDSGSGTVVSTGAGTYIIPIAPFEETGDRLRYVKIGIAGDGAADATVSLMAFTNSGGGGAQAQRVMTNPAGFTTANLNFAFDSSVDFPVIFTAIDDDGSGFSAISAASGSFLLGGVFVGQVLVVSGFSNAANNGSRTVTDVTASAIRFSINTMVDEVGSGDERLLATPLSVNQAALSLHIDANAAGVVVAALRFAKDDGLLT